MCGIAAALGLVGSLVSGMGAMQQANAQAAAANYQAKVSDMNARIESARARDSIQRGQLAEQQKRQQVSQVEGRQKAAMAANGVDVGFGSPLDTLVDTATMGEMDALTVRSNAAREAYGHDVASANHTAQAGLDRMEAQSAQAAGGIGFLSSVLSGVGSAWKSYSSSSTIGAYA